jgi:hypothetical protein
MSSFQRLLVAILMTSSFATLAFAPSQVVHIQKQTLSHPTHAVNSTRKRSNVFTLKPTAPSKDQHNLTPETIAEMIEVSFIQSCMQLASGYVDVLKLFIAAVKAGYEANLPMDDLLKLVENCPVNSARRELMDEEKDLRKEWMLVVYEMVGGLKSDDYVATTDKNNNAYVERVSKVVSSILSIREELEMEEKQTGGRQDAVVAMAALTVEEAFAKSDGLTALKSSCSTPVEHAFLTNDVRVAMLTCKVLEEEKMCTEGSSSGSGDGAIPRPPIPGT